MKLNISCCVNNITGYGHHGRHTLMHLNAKGVDFTLFPIGRHSSESEEETKMLNNAINRQATFDPYATSLRISQPFDLAHHVSKGNAKRVGFTVFELDNFNEREIHHICSNDSIITCSEWGKKVILEKTALLPSEVSVVSLGVETSIFNPHKPNPLNLIDDYNSNKFIVLNVGKSEKRKGHDLIGQIFAKAFTPADNVELWMANHNVFLNAYEVTQWDKTIKDNRMYRKIRILERVRTQQDLSDIMNQASCGFFPARAEGWNLELLEMMACGKPVVCLDYSGQSEYITKDNAFSIEPKELELAEDGKWFFGSGRWAKIDEDIEEFFVESLRTLYKSHQSGIMVPQAALGLQTAQALTWENSVETLIKVLEQ